VVRRQRRSMAQQLEAGGRVDREAGHELIVHPRRRIVEAAIRLEPQ
jgi:hypothetical protein